MAQQDELGWWRRDLVFPGFWRVWPATILAIAAVTVVLVVVVDHRLGIVGPVAVWVAFLVLWGPGGVMRRRADPTDPP